MRRILLTLGCSALFVCLGLLFACTPGNVSSGIVGGGGGGGFDPVGGDDDASGDDDTAGDDDTHGDDDDDTGGGDDDDTGGGDDDDTGGGGDDDDTGGGGDDDDTGGGGDDDSGGSGDDDSAASPTALLQVTVATMSFGAAPLSPTTTLDEVIYLENIGGTALSYDMTLSNTAGGTFLLDTGDAGCGVSTLQPGFGSSCTIEFTPYQAINYETNLVINWEEVVSPGSSGTETLTFTGNGAGAPETDCDDGLDDNGDGTIDCVDPTCFEAPVCNPGVDVCCLGWEGTVDAIDSAQCDEATPASAICAPTGNDSSGNPILGDCTGSPLYDAFCCGVGWDATCASNYEACGASCPSR